MASNNQYEVQREMKMQDNHQMLVQLGLLKPSPKQVTHASTSTKEPVIQKHNSEHSSLNSTRRTVRQSLSDSDDYAEGDGGGGGGDDEDHDLDDDDSLNNGYESTSGCSEVSAEKPPIKHNVYGSIEGVEVGDWWLTSRECWQAGVHRPPATGAPLHCGPDGAYSVTLSDNLSDGDVDGGERFSLSAGGAVHTAAGNLSAQQLSYDTVSLVASMKSRKPVRVVRAHKLTSAYAPDIGYRYDGLYEVENYWVATSKEGATVYKFLLQRCCHNQASPPWLVHKILPTSLHRSVRVKFARALRTATNCNTKHKDQDTLKTKSDGKSRRKVTANGRFGGGAATSGWRGGSGGGDCQPNEKQSFEQLLQRSSTSPAKNALRMQASPSTSRVNQQQKPTKKKNLRRLFENFSFESMSQQQHQQLVLVRNQQLTPEPDPSDRQFDDDLSYLSLKKKSYQESVAAGQAATCSFEAEFVKICEELCSELPQRGGVVYSELPPDNCSKFRGNSCSKMLQVGDSCSKMLQVGDSCSEMLQRSGAACSELPQPGNRLLQVGNSCSKMVQVGDSCSKMLQGAYSELQPGESCSRNGEIAPHRIINSNKRIKFSLDVNNGNNYYEQQQQKPDEFVSVSRNRRKNSKVPRKSSIVRIGEVANGQKKTSIFETDHQPVVEQVAAPPVVCYKSANDFLNALVGCVSLVSGGKVEEEVRVEGNVEVADVKVVGVEEEVGEKVEDGFLGFTAQEVYAAKEQSTIFADFLFRLCEHTDEIQWTGWGLVPRRSIIVNGFLIEQVQRENESEKCDQQIIEIDDSD